MSWVTGFAGLRHFCDYSKPQDGSLLFLLSGSELPLREIKMTWLLVSSVCLSAQDLHYLPSSPVLCVLFFFFPAWMVHCSIWKPAPGPKQAWDRERSRTTSCGPPHWCDARYTSELSSRPPPVALRPRSPQAAGGQCRRRTGVPPMILGCRIHGPRPPSATSLCLSVLFSR